MEGSGRLLPQTIPHPAAHKAARRGWGTRRYYLSSMTPDIVRKLSAELSQPITTEGQVVYVLVQLRKLLDKRPERAEPPYESLRLYCNWVVHTSLTNKVAQGIVEEADTLYPSLIDESLTDAQKAFFWDKFTFQKLRQEMNEFLATHSLPTVDGNLWNSFIACLLNVLEDCPLIFKDEKSDLKHVDEIVFSREMGDGGETDGRAPRVVWELKHKGKHKRFLETTLRVGGRTMVRVKKNRK